MEHDIVDIRHPIRVVGVGARVLKPEAQARIGELWGQAAARGLLHEGPAYGVYTAYEDRLGDAYRVVVGVATDRPLEDGEEAVVLPAGRYAVGADQGPPAQVAADLWRSAWTRWAPPADRSFGVDWERYDGGPDRARVELFIGLKATDAPA